jgi:hypothetical protein
MDIDVSDTCKARSDQLNADDLVGGPITVIITNVSKAESNEQPVHIAISGGYQPFKPCKTMRRALVAAWGKNAAEWIGRSMTLFRDPNVKWAGDAIGGIRISHLSHIQKSLDLSLSESKGKKKKIVIQPLRDHVAEWRGKISDCETIDQLKAIGQQIAKAGLSDTDKAVLKDYYGVRSKELTATPKPNATDLTPQHDVYTATLQEIGQVTSSQQAAQLALKIAGYLNGGELTQDQADELTEKLRVEMN